MPIVFEEVTGEIAPEREHSPPEVSQPQTGDRESDIAQVVRRVTQLAHDRERRLHAD